MTKINITQDIADAKIHRSMKTAAAFIEKATSSPFVPYTARITAVGKPRRNGDIGLAGFAVELHSGECFVGFIAKGSR